MFVNFQRLSVWSVCTLTFMLLSGKKYYDSIRQKIVRRWYNQDNQIYSISQEICTRFLLCCAFFVVIHWLIISISIRLTSLALWQSNDCPSASKATLMNMDKCFMWIHYERLHNHNKAKHNKTVCIFLGIYCSSSDTSSDNLLNCMNINWLITAGRHKYSHYLAYIAWKCALKQMRIVSSEALAFRHDYARGTK